MTLIQSVILGIVQGIAEFLPVSSSGHLAILQHYFGISEGNLFYSIMLHLSTGLVVIILFRKDIKELIKAFFNVIINIFRKRKLSFNSKYEKLMLLIIISSIPTALIGLLFEDYFEQAYTNLSSIGIALIATGMLLFISDKFLNQNIKIEQAGLFRGAVVGLFQGLAIMPGISRSGSTIVGSLLVGLNRKDAARFSFLLSIPAILGAALLEMFKLNTSDVVIDINLIIGMIASFIFGIMSIKILLRLIEKGKLIYFSIYVWILGTIVLILN